MAVRIEKISVKNCGPIVNFREDFADVNLIYSENEKGKSFLVEFIIYCLFRNKSFWKGLRNPGQGKVFVSGLEETLTEFTPTKRKKLEDYFQSQKRGLPPSLGNLLIVKEGESELGKNQQGLDKSTIKEILSPRRVLDGIVEKNISATVRKAKIEDNRIIIERKGEGLTYQELKERLFEVELLINQIANSYRLGELREYEIRRKNLLNQRELMIMAKRHAAFLVAKRLRELKKERAEISDHLVEHLKFLVREFTNKRQELMKLKDEVSSLSEKTKDLEFLNQQRERLLRAKAYKAYTVLKELEQVEKELDRLPEEELNRLIQRIDRFREKSIEREEKERVCRELSENSKDYHWLRSASEEYRRILDSKPNREVFTKVSILSLLFFVLSVTLILFDYLLTGLILNALAYMGLTFSVFKLIDHSKVKLQELEKLRDDFFNRTGHRLTSHAQLAEMIERQERAHIALETYNKDLDRINLELKVLKDEIQESFSRLGLREVNSENWSQKYSELRQRRNHLLKTQQRLRISLEELDGESSDHRLTDEGIEFDRERLKTLEQQIAVVEKLKEQLELKLREMDKIEKELEELEREIKEGFSTFKLSEFDSDNFYVNLKQIEKHLSRLDNEITKLEGLLKGFGVNERDYLEKETGIAFSQEELDKIEAELEEINLKINDKSSELLKLREKIIQVTGADISSSWEELVEQVYLRREKLRRELEEIEAKILAALLVFGKIEELQTLEDQRISEKLNSEEIIKYVKGVTGRYKSISFEQNDIIISDDFFSFRLDELSTGAKEQIMIALRIGFARTLLGDNTAFLIFDDAFQHSDYRRREMLVETLIGLSKQGWQIFYLTMDRHIRELFRSYQNINLKEIVLT